MLGSDQLEKIFLGPWNIAGGILSKSFLRPVYASPILGVLRLLSIRVQPLEILLEPPKCYREPTRDGFIWIQFIANGKYHNQQEMRAESGMRKEG